MASLDCKHGGIEQSQRFLGSLALRDVLAHDDNADYLPVLVADWNLIRLDPKILSLPISDRLDNPQLGHSGTDHLQIIRIKLGRFSRLNFDGFSLRSPRRFPDKFRKPLIDSQDAVFVSLKQIIAGVKSKSTRSSVCCRRKASSICLRSVMSLAIPVRRTSLPAASGLENHGHEPSGLCHPDGRFDIQHSPSVHFPLASQRRRRHAGVPLAEWHLPTGADRRTGSPSNGPKSFVTRTDIMECFQVGRSDPENVGDVFRQLAEFLLAFAQRFFRSLSLRVFLPQRDIGSCQFRDARHAFPVRRAGVEVRLRPAGAFPPYR